MATSVRWFDDFYAKLALAVTAFAIAITSVIVSAAPGDPVFVRISPDITLTVGQRNSIVVWINNTFPAATPSLMTYLQCDRTGKGVECETAETRVVTAAQYVALEAQGLAGEVTLYSGGNATYSHRIRKILSASEKTALGVWINSVSSAVAVELVEGITIWKDGVDTKAKGLYIATTNADTYLTLRSQGLVYKRIGTAE